MTERDDSTRSRSRSRFIEPAIADYALDHTSGPDAVQLELQRVTVERTGNRAGMQIGDDQAVLLEILARATGARRAVEIGTFTGYSALALARGLGPDGRLLCCDVSEEWTAIARDHWEKAGVADRIELRLGPALDTLRSLPPDETFDLAFVDADKTGYGEYYEELLPRLRPGGLLLVDNTLWGGAVLDDKDGTDDTVAIRALNGHIAADPRVRVVLLPIGDGLTVAQRIG
jgi:caffeoyl-CoA O-methyltransferase